MHKLTPILLFSATLFGFKSFAAEHRHYLILKDGKQTGEMTVNRSDDGLTKTKYTYKDNGRGPELVEEFRLAADGSFKEYKLTGQSTFGSELREHFIRTGNSASWKTQSESGAVTLSGPGFYSPNQGSLEPTSTWITALAQSKDGRLPLLPSGSLRQKKLDQLTVEAGGKKQLVQLLALDGIGLAPEFVWATPGKEAKLFAAIEPGSFHTILEAWASVSPSLEKRQKIAEKKYLDQMAKALGEPLDGLTLISNVRIFDSEKAELTPASDVYFAKGRITAVLPKGSVAQGSVNRVDGEGRVLLPGLFDMHGHFGPWEGGLNLAAGVTTVRDLGNDNASLLEFISDIESGHLLAPRIVPAGFLEGESPYSARNGFVIKNLGEAQSAIDWYSQNGYPQLKIYNSFPKDILRETVAYAHSRGLRVSGHVPAFLKAQDVVEAGFDEIQHINQLLLNFFVKPDTDTRTLDRFYLVAEKTADLDLNSKEVQAFIQLMKDRKVVIDPTLTTFDFFQHRDGEVAKAYAMIEEHLPPSVRRGMKVADMKIPDDQVAQRYAKSYAKLIEFVGLMYKAGIPVVAGTDAMAGFTLQRELELYVEAGISPAQALQIATKNGALYSRVTDRGSIAPGKLADLVLVDGDPTQNISDLRKVSLVFTQGKVLHPDSIYQSLGIKPFGIKPAKIERPIKGAKLSQK